MSEEVTFYTNPMSRGRIVHWMLEEAAAPYRLVRLEFGKREHKSPEYLAINPMGKLPAIVHRGVAVTESAAICAYLADAFPAAKLAPAPNDPARGTYFRWLFFGAACVEAAIVDRRLNRPPPDNPGVLGYGTYEETLDVLERALSPGPFVLGESFSAVDVYLASQISFGFRSKSLDERPLFVRYVDSCAKRPAYERFIAKSATMPKG
jgi:glutathione S-transferase